jgi:hypothetical protein
MRDECRVRVFGNWVLRRIFGSKTDVHNEELNDVYCSSNIVRVIKSKMRWAVHVAHMEEKRDVYRERNHLETQDLMGG